LAVVPLSRLRAGLILWSFSAAIFVAAGLLFLVEPMVGKLILPIAGGTPAVWTTSVLFFQVVLLCGYGYAHLVSRLRPRLQAVVHLVVVAAALLALPIAIPAGVDPPAGDRLVFWVLGLLVLVVGLPFFALSSASPLLQHWFSLTGHKQAPDPYFLYRASNLASVAALLAYPFLVESQFGLRRQAFLWAVGYGVFLALLAGAALWIIRHQMATSVPAGDAGARAEAPPISRLRRLRWVAIAATPATWMLAVTSYLTTTVLPLPLLWVVPLALYLLTFAIAFSRRPLIPPAWAARALPFLVLPLAGTLAFRANGPLWLLFPLHLLAFGCGALALHGRLAADRPPAARLTEFYFWVALGGVAGGALAAIVAPLLFRGYWEYPIAITAGVVLLASGAASTARQQRLDLALPAALAAGTLAIAWLLGPTGPVFGGQTLAGLSLFGFLRLSLLFTVPAVIAFSFVRRPVRFGLAMGGIFLVSLTPFLDNDPVLWASRDFFGVHRVVDDRAAGRHVLIDGTVIHGSQNQGALRDLQTTYFSPSGPAGDFFGLGSPTGGRKRVAVIGLGAGTLACYARPDEQWTFYEIVPAVIQIAEDPRLFTFLPDCIPGRPQVVAGDGRLQIVHAADASFDAIVLDAFGSDNVPAHLLTREAIQLYFRKLAPGGALLVNVSNIYVNLRPIFANEAAALGFVCYGRIDQNVTSTQVTQGKVESSWVALARSRDDLNQLPQMDGWAPVPTDTSIPLWTDDFTDVARVTRLG
jgi:hypothetical protein